MSTLFKRIVGLLRGTKKNGVSIPQHISLNTDGLADRLHLGDKLLSEGRLNEAMISYDKIIATTPNLPEAHNNRAVALQALNRLDEAIKGFKHAHALRPNYVEALYNLGAAYQSQNQHNAAVESLRKAIALRANFVDAIQMLGCSLLELNLLDEAIAVFSQVIALRPDHANAHYKQGNAYAIQGKLFDAITQYHTTLSIDPKFFLAMNNLATAWVSQGNHAEAKETYRKALTLQPDFHAAHSNLIFLLDLMADADTATLQAERRRWDAAHAAPLRRHLPFSNSPNPHRRLRVGYVSADFREHSATYVFGAMLVDFDRDQFEVFAYCNNAAADARTQLFQNSVSVWRNIVGLSDEAVDALIRSDQIDILVDLSGHSAGNRLLVFARKPAPIQVTAWGYATSTGLSAIDVFFADPVVVPPEEQHLYTEEVRYLPNVVSYFQPRAFPAIVPLPALANGFVTFGSFNRIPKISDDAFRVWAQILATVPNSRMILKTAELDDAATRDRVLGFFTQAGIAPSRVSLLGKTPWLEHMAAFGQVDIALDPFPHGGGVTALEGLAMGVPYIALRWPTIVGRTSVSILTTLGLTDWIAETPAQYVAIATAKARDLMALASLRKNLRSNFKASIIGDTKAYAQSVEKEYRQLWHNWCMSQKPSDASI